MNDDFKDTEIGKIPKEWEIVNLNNIADYYNGYPFKPTQWKTLGTPIIRIQNLTGSSNVINYFDGLLDSRYKISNGDLLLSWSATLNVYIWHGSDAYLNQHIFKVLPKKLIDKLYLYYVLGIVISKLKNQVHGSTMKHFVKSALSLVYIPLPPLEEQKRIAYVLSKIRNAIDIQTQLIKLLQDLKKSMMHKLFTEGIGHTEFKDTEIGRIPKEWEIKALKDIGNIITGKTPSKSNSEYWLNGKIEFIKPPDLNNNIITTYSEMISESAKNKASIVPKNSVLVSCIGIIGRVGYANKEIAFNQQINGLVLNNKIAYYLFIFYILQYERKQYEILASKTTVPIINKSKFSMISIPLPSLEEQKKIAYILSTIDDKISIETKRKEFFEKLFKTMLNKLMSGQIRTKNIGVIQ